MKQKVVLGMSGGVDSSVAAYLLQQQGYEVTGFFMNCGPRGTTMWPSTINWQEDEAHVRTVAKKLGIDVIMADCELGYEKKVISTMVADYKKGLTPNPDILCNNVGKFPQLLKCARLRGAQFIATGHYARVVQTPTGAQLLTGRDHEKDQSYFLVGLGQRYLRRCLFPLGDLRKEEVRAIAKKLGFANWDKRSSRGICYLGKIDVKKFLASRVTPQEGVIVDERGTRIGTHPGALLFTIGERIGEAKGITLSKEFMRQHAGKKLFVARKKRNMLTVVDEHHPLLQTKRVRIIRLKLVHSRESLFRSDLKARIRHLGEFHRVRIVRGGRTPICIFEHGVEGVAPGQILAIYEGERLVGGGEIRLVRE